MSIVPLNVTTKTPIYILLVLYLKIKKLQILSLHHLRWCKTGSLEVSSHCWTQIINPCIYTQCTYEHRHNHTCSRSLKQQIRAGALPSDRPGQGNHRSPVISLRVWEEQTAETQREERQQRSTSTPLSLPHPAENVESVRSLLIKPFQFDQLWLQFQFYLLQKHKKLPTVQLPHCMKLLLHSDYILLCKPFLWSATLKTYTFKH